MVYLPTTNRLPVPFNEEGETGLGNSSIFDTFLGVDLAINDNGNVFTIGRINGNINIIYNTISQTADTSEWLDIIENNFTPVRYEFTASWTIQNHDVLDDLIEASNQIQSDQEERPTTAIISFEQANRITTQMVMMLTDLTIGENDEPTEISGDITSVEVWDDQIISDYFEEVEINYERLDEITFGEYLARVNKIPDITLIEIKKRIATSGDQIRLLLGAGNADVDRCLGCTKPSKIDFCPVCAEAF